MKRIALLLFTLLGSATCFVFGQAAVSAELNGNAVRIDARSQLEYRRGDIGHRIVVEVPGTSKEVHITEGGYEALLAERKNSEE